MREIAEVMALVLAHVSAVTTSKGERSRAKYTLAPAVVEQAKRRIDDLLTCYPLYPELDLELLVRDDR
jgi:glycine hydroxymethyltransferase